MKRRSLRLRLLFAAAVSIVVALIVAGFGWVQLFERHVERRLGVELETHVQQLAAGIVFDAQDQPHLKQAPADPRFSQPYSGLYWQVEDENRIVMRSRSLWDATLALPASADGLLARCLRGNSEMLGKLSVTDPDCGHEDLLSRSPESPSVQA